MGAIRSQGMPLLVMPVETHILRTALAVWDVSSEPPQGRNSTETRLQQLWREGLLQDSIKVENCTGAYCQPAKCGFSAERAKEGELLDKIQVSGGTVSSRHCAALLNVCSADGGASATICAINL